MQHPLIATADVLACEKTPTKVAGAGRWQLDLSPTRDDPSRIHIVADILASRGPKPLG